MTDELRCIHRHTIATHPACFAKGNVKEVLRSTIKINPPKPLWYQKEDYAIGYLDIETQGLNADFGTTICWCLKAKGGDIVSDYITKEDIFNNEIDVDKRIIQSLVTEMKKYKILVTYYGTYHDIPWVRTKSLRYGIDFPTVFDIYHWDLYFRVKATLSLSSRSLDNTCDYLKLGSKHYVSKDSWRKAIFGNKEAIADILFHNVVDVELTEKLHNTIEFSSKWLKKGI